MIEAADKESKKISERYFNERFLGEGGGFSDGE